MIYEKIKSLSKETGKSIRNIEVEAGLSNGTIGKWNKEKADPTVTSVYAIAKVLGTTVEALVEE